MVQTLWRWTAPKGFPAHNHGKQSRIASPPARTLLDWRKCQPALVRVFMHQADSKRVLPNRNVSRTSVIAGKDAAWTRLGRLFTANEH